MKKIFSLVAIIFILTSCGSIKKMMVKGNIKSRKIQEFTYDMSPSQFKVALAKSFKGWRQVPSSMGEEDKKRIEKLRDELEQGFMYKGQYFSGKGADISSLILLAMAEDKKQAFKAMMGQETFHLLEENEKGFKLLLDNYVYEANSADGKKTSLKISVINKLYKKKSVDLEETIKHMSRSTLMEWDVLKTIDKKSAEQLEASVEADYANGVRL